MTFSMATSFLNLLSMGFTGIFVLTKLGSGMGAGGNLPIGIPPLASIGWLLLALIPISALFSAVALAAALFRPGDGPVIAVASGGNVDRAMTARALAL